MELFPKEVLEFHIIDVLLNQQQDYRDGRVLLQYEVFPQLPSYEL